MLNMHTNSHSNNGNYHCQAQHLRASACNIGLNNTQHDTKRNTTHNTTHTTVYPTCCPCSLLQETHWPCTTQHNTQTQHTTHTTCIPGTQPTTHTAHNAVTLHTPHTTSLSIVLLCACLPVCGICALLYHPPLTSPPLPHTHTHTSSMGTIMIVVWGYQQHITTTTRRIKESTNDELNNNENNNT